MHNNHQKKGSLRCNPEMPNYDYYACYHSYGFNAQMDRQENYDYSTTPAAVTQELVL